MVGTETSLPGRKVENEFIKLAMFELSFDIKVGILEGKKICRGGGEYKMTKNSSSVLFM